MADEQKKDEKKSRMYTEEEYKKALTEAIDAKSRMALCVNIDIGLIGGGHSGMPLAPRATITITGGSLAKVHAFARDLASQALVFDGALDG